MCYRKVEFLFRADFLKFIEENKASIIGRCIEGFYNGNGLYDSLSEAPIVLEFDSFCIVVDYLYYSDATIEIIARDQFRQGRALKPQNRDLRWDDPVGCFVKRDDTFPLYGIPIKDVSLVGFSGEFEINPSTGETRPEGGDYFSVIEIDMEDEQTLFSISFTGIL